MVHYFLDTSALVKRFYEEEGTEVVDELVEDGDSNIVSTSLSVIETVSALKRKCNAGEISEEDMYGLIAAFFKEALGSYLIFPMEEVAFEQAFGLILEDDLRRLDSIQLSAALSLEFRQLCFVCADQDLVGAASGRGLETINPERP